MKVSSGERKKTGKEKRKLREILQKVCNNYILTTCIREKNRREKRKSTSIRNAQEEDKGRLDSKEIQRETQLMGK